MAGHAHPAKIVGEALTFDDVLLVPRRARIHPREIDVATQLTRNIRINLPLVSAPISARRQESDFYIKNRTEKTGRESPLPSARMS